MHETGRLDQKAKRERHGIPSLRTLHETRLYTEAKKKMF